MCRRSPSCGVFYSLILCVIHHRLVGPVEALPLCAGDRGGIPVVRARRLHPPAAVLLRRLPHAAPHGTVQKSFPQSTIPYELIPRTRFQVFSAVVPMLLLTVPSPKHKSSKHEFQSTSPNRDSPKHDPNCVVLPGAAAHGAGHMTVVESPMQQAALAELPTRARRRRGCTFMKCDFCVLSCWLTQLD